MSDLPNGLTPAELYMACTMRKETRGMGYPERLDAHTLTAEDIDNYRRVYGTPHTPDDTDLRDRIAEQLDGYIRTEEIRDIATALLPVIAAELDARWEQGCLHGLRQAHQPGDARARQLEADIQMMLTIEEGTNRAWGLKCARVRELEAENTRLQALADRRWVAWQSARERAQAYGEGILRHVEERNWALGWLKAAEGRAAAREADLDAATHFLVGPYRVAWQRFREEWEVWPDPALISLTTLDDPEDFPTRTEALAHARGLAEEARTDG